MANNSGWPTQIKYDQFFLFGDSITQAASSQKSGFGFAAQLTDYYIRRLDVVNRGLSGYNTSQALHVLPSIIPDPKDVKIRFLFIFFGANDACLPHWESKQHVPLDQYSRNLEAIISHPSVKAHSPRIILVTPPPVDEHQFLAEARLNRREDFGRTADQTKAYADACREVGNRQNVAVLDLWARMMEKAGWIGEGPLLGRVGIEQSPILKDLLADGLHFNPLAYRVLYDALISLISEKWPDQTNETLEMVLPGWMKAPPYGQ